MWRNWDVASVDADMQALAKNGMQVLRVFPLWSDFQPITAHEGWSSLFVEMRMGEEPLPDTQLGRAGVDSVMIQRFREFAGLAEKYHLKLIVGMMTGWMSGRMHKPPAFNGVNVLTDPLAVKWQVRFVRAFVRELKDSPAITAWDLGNESNCMGELKRSSELWNWSNAISSAIRLEDSSRPVVSGMHALQCVDGGRPVLIEDQAETTDVLCTHPYPCFTPHCKIDPLNTIRNAFHAAAETRLYTDVGGIPAFVEEAGSLGPGVSSEMVAAKYLENMLWNTFAHDCRGLLWWCSHDQTLLKHTPYDWVSIERSLGLLRSDSTPKPVMEVLGKFGRMIKGLRLPAFRRNAVCILTEGQDQWGIAYMTFLLAKQAGFDLEFQYADQPLKPSKFYLMPSVHGSRVIQRHRWEMVLGAVKDGATLYVSSDDGTLEPFYGETAGMELEYIAKSTAPARIICDQFDLTCNSAWELKIRSLGAEVLAYDGTGNPALTSSRYGKGTILFGNAPLEASLMEQPRAFSGDFFRLYQLLANAAGVRREVTRTSPMLTLTEHFAEDGSMFVCAVNNTPDSITDTISAPDWEYLDATVGPALCGNLISLSGNSGTILRFRKK